MSEDGPLRDENVSSHGGKVDIFSTAFYWYCELDMGDTRKRATTTHELPGYREETIRYLTSEEGARWYGEKIPRWKAEQMVATPGKLDLSEKKFEEEREWEKRLSRELHGRGPVGQAFRELCKAGCTPEWLENVLLSTRRYPLKRSRKSFRVQERKRVEQIVRDLDAAAHALKAFTTMMFLSGVEHWPVPPHEVPTVLGGLAYCLRECMTSPTGTNLRDATASFRIPYLVNEIKRQTGRPRYAQMATLLGAVYGREEFSEADLKMFVSRNHHGRRSK
jgi:hypothetical protein